MVSLICKLTVFPTLDLVRDNAVDVHRLGVWALIDDPAFRCRGWQEP
ncbi:hypothetical protein PC129_g8801 [Phytophthora cactorum]|uniref:Uncharacterized protein n=1 Tax=Phytophthora cactorum TaxID=29920 RepID=A0A8T1KUT7_9STRA|nr:hypothetical protein Pcac1_g1303 [Phytophthora cactorum]KAG2807935.1 hypothetical protein PC111_g16711 [Phytophthora cactorum]KAG2824552.1 hypothetical protein PC112_g10047 [Phytophthora cactorum]KAG2891820.1 hypothetical protein PC114_g16838 [Phytophthora cactorum]KAG2921513.1 hypothetical protein PC117_g16214 [Phytophthora cactorum]